MHECARVHGMCVVCAYTCVFMHPMASWLVDKPALKPLIP